MRLAPLVAVVSLTACAPLSEGMPEEVKRRTPIGMLNIDVYEGEPSNTFSLTIGVNDYSDYDRSLGQEVGTSDLSGAVNDALLWWRVSNTIGVPIPRIRVLTTPSMLDAPWQIGRTGSLRPLVVASGASYPLAEPSAHPAAGPSRDPIRRFRP
ncbi:MAG: hypothetical protein ACI8PZ_007175, partial [Myxococcota bacterium]